MVEIKHEIIAGKCDQNLNVCSSFAIVIMVIIESYVNTKNHICLIITDRSSEERKETVQIYIFVM